MADDEDLKRDFARLMASPATPHVSEETWQSLATGTLPADERASMASHVVTCDECSAIYRSLQELEAGARAFDGGVPAPVDAKPAIEPRLWIAAAAAMLLAVTAFALLRPTPTSTPAPEISQQPAPEPIATLARIDITAPEVRLSAERALATRGTPASTFLERFGAAITPYREGRYEVAAKELAAVSAEFPDAYEPKFYGAVSLLLSETDPATAADLLDQASAQAPADWRDDIQWYRAAALQRAKQDDAARSALAGLCEGESRWKAQACDALKPPSR